MDSLVDEADQGFKLLLLDVETATQIILDLEQIHLEAIGIFRSDDARQLVAEQIITKRLSKERI